jgi:hypothetical protein
MMDGNCAVNLTRHRNSFQITSSCPEFSSITYASALKGSKTTPCMNVPVICELCVQPNNSNTIPAVWRYNLNSHVNTMHPGHTQTSQFSQKFLELLLISDSEQLAMGIPKEQIPPLLPTSASHGTPRGIKRRALEQPLSPKGTKYSRPS